MTPADEIDEPNLLSLPEDLFNDIGSYLDDKDVCHFEQASRAVYKLVSRPSRNGPCERRLDLISRRLPLLQEESRSVAQPTSF